MMQSEHDGVTMTRIWAMAASNTFDCPPIRDFVKKYLSKSSLSIDPFSRNNLWTTYTNDLNPKTNAEHHMKADVFLKMLVDDGVKADLIIFDPPYSIRQVKECYDSIGGVEFEFSDTQNAMRWTVEKELCNKLLLPGGYFLHFGWHSNGMGKKYKCELIEVLLVAHGSGHHDTICIAEKKIADQMDMFATGDA
jgi:hypothetical protein